jgi:cytochrome d ubiquinol oxidase subunit II
METLWPAIWFVLVGVLLAVYAALDGFDLGAGVLHLFVRRDEERRTVLNAIGPVWDGNEVWLLTGGGALFAAFPEVYATVFSGFYLAMMLVLVALITRAVGIEFRSRLPGAGWRRFWDVAFGVASALAAILLGCALGNLVRGLPLDARHEYGGGLPGLLNPHGLLCGVAALALFMFHGALYLATRTDGALRDRARGWAGRLFPVVAGVLAMLAAWVALRDRHILANFGRAPALAVVPALVPAALIGARRLSGRGRDVAALLCSAAAIVALAATAFVEMFPNLVLALNDPANSLTIRNAASSPRTHRIMFVIALTGLPLVIAYTAAIYWIFRKPVRVDADGY